MEGSVGSNRFLKENQIMAAKKAPAKTSSAAETKIKAQNAELKARIKVLEKALKDTVKNINKVLG